MIKYFPSYILPHSEGDIKTRTSSVKIQLRNCTCHTSGAVTRFNLQHKKLEKMYDYSQDLSPCPAGKKKKQQQGKFSFLLNYIRISTEGGVVLLCITEESVAKVLYFDLKSRHSFTPVRAESQLAPSAAGYSRA